MKRQVLEIDKMQHLNELGVDINKASMCWIREPNSDKYHAVPHDEFCYEMSCLAPIATFTLMDIIELIPPRLKEKYVFHIHKVGDHYHLEYSYPGCDATLHTSYSHNLLDAAYDMYVWYLTKYKTSNF